MKISVVIPVYGCPEAIPELHRRLTETLSQIVDEDYEIILVNDACPRNSWAEIVKVCTSDRHVTGIEMSRNFGQIKAILAGLDHSSGDWVVVMDCDLQDCPEEIIKLYQKAKEGYDVVFARRAIRQDSAIKIFLSSMFYKVYSWATNSDYDPALCNFSICSRKVIDAYCSMRELHRAYIMYIKWLGFRQAVVNVEHNARFAGESGYNMKKRINMAIEILTSQSDKLLRQIVKVGLGISLLSFLAVVILFIKHFISQSPAGWSSIIVAIFFMSGLILASIGIVGIYVGNIFMEEKHRPLYVIRTLFHGHTEVK
jgi:glycosyltransferase involved in cell wall biosynthesis